MLDNIEQALKSQDDRLDSQIRDFPREYRSELKRELNELKSKLDQLHIEEHKAFFEREQSRIDQQFLGRKRRRKTRGWPTAGPTTNCSTARSTLPARRSPLRKSRPRATVPCSTSWPILARSAQARSWRSAI